VVKTLNKKGKDWDSDLEEVIIRLAGEEGREEGQKLEKGGEVLL